MSKDQPMIKQYLAIKEVNKDAVLFFQVGTFYQLYYHDAALASDVLDTKIISRAIGKGQRIPMCGIPKPAGKKYAEILARKGYRSLLCDQTDQKDENGIAVRIIAKEVKPEETMVVVDLSQDWDEYLTTHSFEDLNPPKKKHAVTTAEESILKSLSRLDINSMTPMEALNLLQEWKQSYVHTNNSL